MIIKKCIICIGGTDYLDAKLSLTKQRADALVLTGKRTSKQLVKYLKSKGGFNISIIEL
jgi:hypothetical protein